MASSRRHKIGSRRRVEDEGDDHDNFDDDSMSEGTLASDEHDLGNDSDTSNIDDNSPTAKNGTHKANGHAPRDDTSTPSGTQKAASNTATADTEAMLNGLSVSDDVAKAPQQELHFDDTSAQPQPAPSNGPVIVSSASAGRRRQEHEDYKKKRDEDPAFVPNRGNFFMHDHRHSGPAANGFRPFARGRGRGGRMGYGGPTISHMNHPGDPIISNEWKHDMHEAVLNPGSQRQHQHRPAPPNSLPPAAMNSHQHIPKCPPSKEPINRILSTERHLGTIPVRVKLPYAEAPTLLPAMLKKQYTKLPDHRPPLRSDKPVKISLPDWPVKWIYPADDRSFKFIPRALRPNQQRMRGKSRSGFGPMGGYSRRTSIVGAGSFYGGSVYSPSVAMSRRSSMAAYDRDAMFSPTGSIASRAPAGHDAGRPVVRLPPAARPDMMGMPAMDMAGNPLPIDPTLSNLPQPQNYALPQRPAVGEIHNTAPLALHQPRPQKNISVADLDTPDLTQLPTPFQGTFHQQIPVQMANGLPHEGHSRQPSYPTQLSSGTPLSQIPERAIHAAPFQPQPFTHNTQQPQSNYYQQPQQAYVPPVQQQQQQHQQGYYYPPAPYNGAQNGYGVPPPGDASAHAEAANAAMVAQEANGMVYYGYHGQMPAQPSYQYPGGQSFQPSVVGMGGMVTPSPDGYYYPQGTQANGMMYY